MRKYLKKKDKFASSESVCKNGQWITKYFHLYCDICGVKHPEICVNELCEEEGFPEGDYCWNCQRSMQEQGFVKEKDRDEKGHIVLERAIKRLRQMGFSKIDMRDFLNIQVDLVTRDIR